MGAGEPSENEWHFCLRHLGEQKKADVPCPGPYRREAAVLQPQRGRTAICLGNQDHSGPSFPEGRAGCGGSSSDFAAWAGAAAGQRRLPGDSGAGTGLLGNLRRGHSGSTPVLVFERPGAPGEFPPDGGAHPGAGAGCYYAADGLRCAHWDIPVRRPGFQPHQCGLRKKNGAGRTAIDDLFRWISGERQIFPGGEVSADFGQRFYRPNGGISAF